MESVRSPPSSLVPSSDAVPSSWLCRQRSGLRTAVEGRVDKRLGVSQVGSENLAALDPEWLQACTSSNREGLTEEKALGLTAQAPHESLLSPARRWVHSLQPHSSVRPSVCQRNAIGIQSRRPPTPGPGAGSRCVHHLPEHQDASQRATP